MRPEFRSLNLWMLPFMLNSTRTYIVYADGIERRFMPRYRALNLWMLGFLH